MANRYFIQAMNLDSIKNQLINPSIQWKDGHSAKLLAETWFNNRRNKIGFPKNVHTFLTEDPTLKGIIFLNGFFEYSLSPKGRGNPSRTDLMIHASVNGNLYVIGIEGKAKEPFEKGIKSRQNSNQKIRLEGMCKELEIDINSGKNYNYQLLHRTWSTIVEAKRYGASSALMLVHSFTGNHVEEFKNFGSQLGFKWQIDSQSKSVKILSKNKKIGKIKLKIGFFSE